MELIVRQTVTVVDGNRSWQYMRTPEIDGMFPGYVAPVEKHRRTHRTADTEIIEILFLPINEHDMECNIGNRIGYKITFSNQDEVKISLDPSDETQGMTSGHMYITVARFKFHITPDDEIVIDRQYDYLYPMQVKEISDGSGTYNDRFVQTALSIYNTYADFYYGRSV